jgi:hypothetical protein
MSLLSWLVVLSVVAFFASAAFKVLPHYFDNMALEKLITSVETDKAANIRTINEFYSHVSKGMQVNSIRDLNLQDALKVKMENNEFRAHLKYEKREPLIENIDLVVRFDKEFRVRMP